MDPVLLSRIQFALTVGFHYIFPAATLGLVVVIVTLETRVLRRKDAVAREASTFLVRVLGLVFTIGVATGIVLAVTLGTNWSGFSRMVGDVFGIALAAEGMFAFFLESAFLGILLFGRDRVSPRVYWLSAVLVAVGAHLSGLWILIANSWMQTPAGYAVTDGRVVLTDFWAAVGNASTGVRFFHTILGGWISGSLLVAGIAAWYLLRDRHREMARASLRVAMAVLVVAALLMPFAGHLHSVQVALTQPAKLAAFEGLWESQPGAPMALFGIPDEATGQTHFAIGIPGLLSLLVYFDPNAVVTGLNDIPADERPPVLASFASYHVMIALGALFALLAVVGIVLRWRGKLESSRWYLKAVLFAVPLSFLANEIGWMAAEIGRQPWTVYGVLRTVDAASVVVPAWQILTSLVLLAAVYALLLVLFLARLRRIVREGPGSRSEAHVA